MRKIALHWQILIAILLAGIVGTIIHRIVAQTGIQPSLFGVEYTSVLSYVGTIFLNALKMIIVPLIMSSIIVGVAGIGTGGDLGALAGKTLLFYVTTTVAAILVGLIVINVVAPGFENGQPVGEQLALTGDTTQIAANVAGRGPGDVAGIFLEMVPPNIVKAAVEGQMLGIIFFAILFGYFMTRLSHDFAEPLFNFWNGVFHVMMRMTEWIMKFAPIGVFGLVSVVIANAGLGAARPLFIFAVAVLFALAVHAFVILPLLLRFVGRVNPLKVLAGASKAMLTAFSTASSSATLPVTMDCVEKNIGVSNKISSFVLPLGATVNMNGTALYECAAAMFIAQAYGLDLTFGVQFAIVVIALMTSIGVAGVPSASLVAIAIILTAIGLPIEAVGVLMVFDRVLDMARTSINIWGDISCATIVARLEGEKTNVI